MVRIHYEIDDELHYEAKVAAAEQRVSLKQFVETALRAAIDEHNRGKRRKQ